MKIVTKYLEGAPLLTTYVVEVGGVKVVVDPGPASLYQPMDVDAVLCTHLHLDHCGSAGHLGRPVYVHERYIRHVVDPSRLYESSRAVLGIFAEKFGRPLPNERAVGVADGARLFDAFDVYYTPGHAPHHIMYFFRDQKVLFTGDGAGVYIPELGVVIPTTPPPFKLDMYLQSLERVKALGAEAVCFPHYSCTRDVDLIKRHVEQVKSWVEALGGNLDKTADEALRELARVDPNVERVLAVGGLYLEFYLRFSVLGFMEYLKAQRASS
ncbi:MULTISPECIES: MBL fold metallo-hydrolase [Pyrobaculum]|uniref:Beta-lactamase domain protein n=2 Tax=Pyrobaculum arsenaticum TaxID=121277 RepID=A4WIL3_PYRAR|nr:MBL fold metallo-hydrolase [Pyrobaculum arsenaticum]ABP50230.1 beta-lactamase domain protein [Pyrobaculum arsenaticum DSM 13514]MCY0889874.1 MBL fold metallo-hydrolase [Pyrobaculum arsenaticum]NYR14833.1 MBL fold metallo-hydrolase [Pyrobaculum arsenaticum]